MFIKKKLNTSFYCLGVPNKVFIMISFLKWPINFFPKMYLKFRNFPNDKKNV